MQRWVLWLSALVVLCSSMLSRIYDTRISVADNVFVVVLSLMEVIQGPLYRLAATDTSAIEAVREQWLAFPLFQPRIPQDMNVLELNDDTAPLPLIVFRGAATAPDAPLLVWFHGGGFVFGRARSKWAVELAANLPLAVVSVELPLAPDTTFPEIPEAAMRTLRWVHANRDHVGATSKSRVGVGGMSSGATIAAAVACMNDAASAEQQLPLDLQLLVAPLLDWPGHSAGYLTPEGQRSILANLWFFRMYVGRARDAARRCIRDYRCTPAHAKMAGTQSPQALIVVGELDAAKEEAVAYAAQRVREARVIEAHATHMGVLMRLDRDDRAWNEMLDALRKSELLSAT